jgi:serine/threonine protein kinase
VLGFRGPHFQENEKSSLIEYFRGYDQDPNFESFLELVSKMLTVDPVFRITAEEALNHSFFREGKSKDIRSPFYQSTASSIENSPSSKLSTGLFSVLFSPSRLSSTGNDEQLIRSLCELPRRTSLQEPRKSSALFSHSKE